MPIIVNTYIYIYCWLISNPEKKSKDQSGDNLAPKSSGCWSHFIESTRDVTLQDLTGSLVSGKQPKTGTVKTNIFSKDFLRTYDTDTNLRWICDVCCAFWCNDHHGRLHSWHSLLAPKAFTLPCRTRLWALQISVTVALVIKLRLSIRLHLYKQALR